MESHCNKVGFLSRKLKSLLLHYFKCSNLPFRPPSRPAVALPWLRWFAHVLEVPWNPDPPKPSSRTARFQNLLTKTKIRIRVHVSHKLKIQNIKQLTNKKWAYGNTKLSAFVCLKIHDYNKYMYSAGTKTLKIRASLPLSQLPPPFSSKVGVSIWTLKKYNTIKYNTNELQIQNMINTTQNKYNYNAIYNGKYNTHHYISNSCNLTALL